MKTETLMSFSLFTILKRWILITYRRIDEFFFAPRPIYPLVLCRITFGMVIFLHYARLLPSFFDIFGATGVGGHDFFARFPNLAWFGRETSASMQFLRHVSSDNLIFGFYVLLLLSSLSFSVGFFTRTSGVIALILNSIFFSRNEYVFWGWGDLIKPFVFYVILSDSGKYFSVDHWRRSEKTLAPPMTPAWPIRLIQFHLMALYFVVSTTRMPNPHWQDGTMVHRILTNGFFSRFPYIWDQLAPITTLLSHIAWYGEIIAPLLLWAPVIGPVFSLFLISMHLGLEVLTMVGWWNLMAMSALTTFFPKEWWTILSRKSSLR